MQPKSNQKNVFLVVKLTVALISFGYISYIFFRTPDFYIRFLHIWTNKEMYFHADSLWFAILLVPINWGIEAYKWKFLASKVENISLKNAYGGVLAGLCLGFITPHAVGDYAARIYFMHVKHRLRAVGAILLARISLFYITLLYGVIGFVILFRFTQLDTGFFNLDMLIPICLFLGIIFVLIFNYELVSNVLTRISLFRKYIHPYFKIIGNYSTIDLAFTFMLSLLRYAVFTIQYLLILQFFGVNVYDVLVLASVCMIFFAKSIFPSFNFLNDVGVREAAALFFLGNIGLEEPIIITASLTVWVINIFIPALLGLGVILGAKKNQNIVNLVA